MAASEVVPGKGALLVQVGGPMGTLGLGSPGPLSLGVLALPEQSPRRIAAVGLPGPRKQRQGSYTLRGPAVFPAYLHISPPASLHPETL